MPKGNTKNHSRKYLTREDFYAWVGNDFSHLCSKVARHEGILWTIAILLAAILAKQLGVY